MVIVELQLSEAALEALTHHTILRTVQLRQTSNIHGSIDGDFASDGCGGDRISVNLDPDFSLLLSHIELQESSVTR